MKTDRYNNYSVITDIKSLKEISGSDVIRPEDAAVVFDIPADFSYDSEDAEFLANASFITIIKAEDFSNYSLDLMMMFDQRVSSSEFNITSEMFSNINIEKYTLLCGRKDAYELSVFFSKRTSDTYTSKLVKKLEGDSLDTAVTEYCDELFKEKSSFGISCLVKCLTTARSGKLEDVFREESENFYRMVKEKAEEM